ncbi:hypothetical protein [uncultured Methanobrevibacter sp.]|uniref:hypothetical protein n=1 Tax=uncultured Methanobrevibacter sp. TaxID=253161 RepID=UPI0025E9E6F8|nr:hypothetical protein [uncultured Methanobrevibacter sp.]
MTENYIIEDCKKAFKLDGTEPTGNFSRGSITCSGGILSGKSGYVKGFDNTNEWILSFDVYHINYTIVPIVATTTTHYNGNYVQILGSYVRVITNGNFTDYPFDSGATKKYNEWQNIKIIKENGQYTLYFDDVFAATFTTPWNPTQLGVGFDAWNGSNSGQIKNIKVKPL